MQFDQWRLGLDDTEAAHATVLLGLARHILPNSQYRLKDLIKLLDKNDSVIKASPDSVITLQVNLNGVTFDDVPSASDLAKDWTTVETRYELEYRPFRVEVVSDYFQIALPFAQLLNQFFACYWRSELPRCPIAWRWPLRIGFMGALDVSRETEEVLRREMTQNHIWAGNIASMQLMTHDIPECDLLVVTDEELDHLLQPEQMAFPWKADVVLICSQREERLNDPRIIAGVQLTVRCSAVALQLLSGPKRTSSLLSSYLIDLVREISHSHPFDIAVRNATATFFRRWHLSLIPPLLIADRRFLENSSIQQRLKNLRYMMSGDLNTPLPPLLWNDPLGMTSHWEAMSFKEVADDISGLEESIGYFRESDMATLMSQLEQVTADGLHRSAPPRFIQATVGFIDGRGKRKAVKHTFIRERKHYINVLIGPPQSGWFGPALDHSFPNQQLPTDIDENELQVHLIVLHSPYNSYVDSVILPRRGVSTQCRFELDLPQGVDEVWLRLAVTFRNRVLQTAILRGPVGSRDVIPRGVLQRLTLNVETVNASRLDSLHERTFFDSAILVNRTPDETPLIGTLSGGRFTFRDARDIVALQQSIEKAIGRIARDRGNYHSLETEDSRKLLIRLANDGSDFRLHLEDQQRNISRQGSRIQVTSVEVDRRIPIEFCYDGLPPDDDARVCPDCLAALANGNAAMECPGGANSHRFVCPLSFWALNRVIERHMHDPDHAKKIKSSGDDYLLTIGDNRPESGIALFDRVLCGINWRVNSDGEARIYHSIVNRATESPVIASDWDTWKHVIGCSPSLLLLVGHTASKQDNPRLRRIEIGVGAWRDANKMSGYIQRDDKSSQPVVLLFACEADQQEAPMHDFVCHIRRAGAAIVVTTNCAIHVEHAVQLVETFIPQLHEICRKEGTLGEALRNVRRAMMAKGTILPLCLTAFGDADWKLTLPSEEDRGEPLRESQFVPVGPVPNVEQRVRVSVSY